jgi:hypothetical protein
MDQDAQLIDGSSLGGASAFGPPDSAKVMEMRVGVCLACTQVTSTDGTKVPYVCSQTIKECQQHHAMHCLNGR